MSARQLCDEVLVGDTPVLGQRVAYLLPVISDDAPYAIREGIARRRIAATTGRCPCGAVADYGERRPGEAGVGEVHHERLCPAATTARLVKAYRRWLR
jgi:hypothetical protein